MHVIKSKGLCHVWYLPGVYPRITYRAYVSKYYYWGWVCQLIVQGLYMLYKYPAMDLFFMAYMRYVWTIYCVIKVLSALPVTVLCMLSS